MADFQSELNQGTPGNEEIIAKIDADNEKDYLKQLKAKNKDYLVGKLTFLERERIAKFIVKQYKSCERKQKEIADNIERYDAVWKMKRQQIPGDDGTMPNYRTPLTTVTLEVIHANYMNVFFTPKEIMRVLPTEENDIKKTKKIAIFGNWSMENELNIFQSLDRLWHASTKSGECPFILHWVKEYGTEIKHIPLMNPARLNEPLIDPDTQQVVYQEVEEQKLLYNGPKLEIFSRKDYYQPDNAVMDKIPEFEGRIVRINYDDYLRAQLQGKLYDNSMDEIEAWGGFRKLNASSTDDDEDDELGDYEQEFIEHYCRLRINVLKDDADSEFDEYEELEQEFIALVHVESETLCALRKNKFPLQMRPIGVDYFIPDDEGSRSGIGVVEFMDSQQKSYDALYNQYIFGVMQSNNPFGFFSPMGNQRDEPIKTKNGYLYPTTDPQSINIVKIPPPDSSMEKILELVRYWAQLLFGIGDYQAGVESQIDPSAPARKAEIVVQQGNVRLNTIIKRKNATFQDICKRWFLLYQANMPKNKFMRIAGSDEDNPWKFEAISLQDFALKSIPDFELTGNILNSNKALEAQKKIGIYQLMVQNPLFNPATVQGMQALHELTAWLLDGMDDSGISRFLPKLPDSNLHTPEEENAMFMQGDLIKPQPGQDHVYHLQIHRQMYIDPTVPEVIKQQIIMPHINETVDLLRNQIMTQQVMQRQGLDFPPQGAMNGSTGQGAPGAPAPLVATGQPSVAGFSGGAGNMPGQR